MYILILVFTNKTLQKNMVQMSGLYNGPASIEENPYPIGNFIDSITHVDIPKEE